MDFMTIVKTRRSIRSYLTKGVETEKLDLIMEAGRLAPSARNLQNLKIVAVRDKERIGALKNACNGQDFIAEAPVFLAVCAADEGGVMACGMPRHIVDASIAMTHMILAAASEGLGTCWIGSFQQNEVKRILNVPKEGWSVVAVAPLGYVDEIPEAKERKTPEELFAFEIFE